MQEMNIMAVYFWRSILGLVTLRTRKQRKFRGNMVLFKLSVLMTPIMLISACAAPKHIVQHDVIQFKGDVQPKVTSEQAMAGDLSNLSEGETLFLAVAKDGSGAMSQPDIAEVSVVETILTENDFDKDLMMQRCDPDGDGILDVYCPALISAMRSGMLGTDKFVMFQSWYKISSDKSRDEDYWGNATSIDKANVEERNVPIHLKMLTINRGNQEFHGDITIYAQIPPQTKVVGIDVATKVKDTRSSKSGIEDNPFLPIIGPLIASTMDDYTDVKSVADFRKEITPEGNAKVVVHDITLEPGEGINLEYTTTYTIED